MAVRPHSRNTSGPQIMMEAFSRTLAALALGLSSAIMLVQGEVTIASIDVSPITGNASNQAIALMISGTEAGSTLVIEGSAD